MGRREKRVVELEVKYAAREWMSAASAVCEAVGASCGSPDEPGGVRPDPAESAKSRVLAGLGSKNDDDGVA